jgi:lipoprotein NlpI
MRAFLLIPLALLLLLPLPAAEEAAGDLFKKAQTAYGKRDWSGAVKLAGKAIARDAKMADAYSLRGAAHFMLGKFKESVADFDRELKLRPRRKAGHWQRGISLYYAGQFDEGRKQFAAYEAVSDTDVENAVWHFLCVARKDGVAKARAGILKIRDDKRIPMMKVYDLFKGKCKPADVLAAVRADEVTGDERKQRLFYAHLYLGLYHDARKDRKKALEHMKLAGGKYRIGHYMGEVARVHLELLRKEAKKK